MALSPIFSYHDSNSGKSRVREHDALKQTDAEIAAGVTPVNYAYPPGNVHRYGAGLAFDDSVDDLTYFDTAVLALGSKGGKITGIARKYRINGTLEIQTLCTFDFGTNNNGGDVNGFILFSDSDAPILRYTSAAVCRFVTVGRVSIVGSAGAGLTAQHGIVVDNGGIRLAGASIRTCGGSGIVILDSFSANYENVYISLCDANGILVSGHCGANVWKNVSVSECGVSSGADGVNIDAADGSDLMLGCISEKNGGYGFSFGEDVEGWNLEHTYTELNALGSVLFKAGSDKNHVHFNSWSQSSGEADPSNVDGVDNTWSGRKYLQRPIKAKLIDHVTVEYDAFDTDTPNAIPLDDTVPQSNEGTTVMSATLIPKRPLNLFHVTGVALMRISAGSHAIVSAFIGAAASATYAHAQATAVDVLVSVPIDFWYEAPDTTSVTVNVNIGSNAAATVALNGISGRLFGAITKSTLSIEEYWP
jgi:hypothetical protein